ncbi:MAG: PspA/IM30 family protein [Planctomycetales bacterium]|nr:PspA/IM30 family protein [Planctomycetales bacterium]
MNWIKNFTLIMRSSVTTLREKIEDPERMLHQLIIDMEEELERVRAAVAGAIADEIQMNNRWRKAQEESNQWFERAGAALRRNDETTAKAALEHKVACEQRAESLEREYRLQKEQVVKLRDSVRDLEDKIRQAKQKQTLLLARLVRADSAQRVQNALKQTTSNSAFAQFSRLEGRVERAEAMSQAYDQLDGVDPDAAELERRFAETERQERLQTELEALKQKMKE